MPYCAVPSCTNGTGKGNSNPPGIAYHRLPSDPSLADRWWHIVQRKGERKAVKDPRICSAHFPASSFKDPIQPNTQNREGQTRRILLPSAVPYLNIPASHPSIIHHEEERGTGQRRHALGEQPSACSSVEPCYVEPRTPPCVRSGELEKEVARLKAELHALRDAPAAGMKSGLFTGQQALFLSTGVRPCPWDEETVLKALQHRVHTSRRQYSWLRQQGYPLPGLTTLQKWLSDFVVRPESCALQMELLKKMLDPLAEQDRCCVVMFDEMDIMSVASYDSQMDQVLGPHKNLQQYMAGGIFKDWKLPVMYGFDQAPTKTILLELILAMERAGARVVSIVSDMGGKNQAIWKELGVAYDGVTSFSNPADPNRHVWVMADPPHLMKRLRDNILNHGIKTSGGGVLNRGLMREIIAIDGTTDHRILHKLHLQTHVEVSGMARQKVRPCLQLLSASSAHAVDRYLDGRDEEARTLRLFDGTMDVLNAIHPGDKKTLRRGYRGSGEQERVLNDAMTEVTEMRVGNARGLYPFQKGLMVTIQSMRGLLRDIQSRYGEVYLLTRRLTQDRLEGFFGMVRGRGGSSLNPTPTEAKARIRLLTLLFVMQRGVNPLARVEVAAPDDDPEASSQMVEQLEEMEVELEAAADPELAADLLEFAGRVGEVISDEEEDGDAATADLNDLGHLLDQASTSGGVTVATLGALDKETGVSAADSAMAHVAGYLARKRPGDRSIGAPSASAESGPVQALWTRVISAGGLTVPTEAFYATYTEMEAVFCTHHCLQPDGLSRQPGVVRNLLGVLEDKFPLVHPKIRSSFARIRTFIRMGAINRARRADSLAKRAARKRRHYAQ